MRSLGAIRWIALALAGLAVAAGVSLAASQLVSERIGLAAEPVSAGRELAPANQENQASARNGGHRHGDTTTAPPASTTSVPATTTPPATTTSQPSYTTPSATAPAPAAPSPPAAGSGAEHEGADD